MKYLVSIFIILLLSGCSKSDDTEGSTVTVEETSTYDDGVQAAEEAPTYSGQSFDGNPCVGDCSGHEAGYQWAEENSITDPDTCGGNSDSFIEGCQSYAEEQQ